MAYRRSRGKSGKIQPAVHTLTFTTPVATDPVTYDGTWFIDLSQVASIVNRRFYRQGLQWAVSNIKVASSRGGTVYIEKLPNTWVMSNAWEKGFRSWQKMNKDALSEAPSVKPKFLDFKIYADGRHHQAGFAANLLPIDSAGNTATPGEWESSKVIIPFTTSDPGQAYSAEIVATGPNDPGVSPVTGYDAKSLIEGYAASRGLPNIEDPNTPADAVVDAENWMTTMFNEGTKQDDYVLDDMTTENNIAPYPFENGDDGAGGVYSDTMYPGGANQLSGLEFHDFVNLVSYSGNDNVSVQNLKGGMFPCGLIGITWDGTESNLTIQIDLVPGSHRGYVCAPMTDM